MHLCVAACWGDVPLSTLFKSSSVVDMVPPPNTLACIVALITSSFHCPFLYIGYVCQSVQTIQSYAHISKGLDLKQLVVNQRIVQDRREWRRAIAHPASKK